MKKSIRFLCWLLIGAMFCAVSLGGCGGHDDNLNVSQGEQGSTGGDTTNGRGDGWEDVGDFSYLSGVWSITDVSLETVGDYVFWDVDTSSFSRDIRILADDNIIVWANAHTPDSYSMEPLKARFVHENGVDTREASIIVSAAGFEKKDDSYETPVTANYEFDRIELDGNWPWDSIKFIHSESDYVTTTTLHIIDYDKQ